MAAAVPGVAEELAVEAFAADCGAVEADAAALILPQGCPRRSAGLRDCRKRDLEDCCTAASPQETP